MKNIISKFINVSKPQKKLNEAVENNDAIQVYMNTWKNYNEYGADLEAYGIKDGWMSIDDAIEFCKKYAEDEPFINDVDNCPIEVSEYDNAPTMLENLKKIENFDGDKECLDAALEAEYPNYDLEDLIKKVEDGDVIFYPGVTNDDDLGHANVDMCGGISAAVPKDRLRSYIDEESLNDTFEAEGGERLDDDTLDEYINNMIDSGSEDFLDNYFDYEAWGRDLAYDYSYTSQGAIQIL